MNNDGTRPARLPRARRKLIRLFAALAAGIVFVGGTASATYEGSVSVDHTSATGILAVNLGAHGPDNRLDIAADHVVPGDSITRQVKLTTGGDVSMTGVSLTVTASTS